jgi:uncharacterized protein
MARARSYKSLEKEIMSNKKYMLLNQESHHGLTRLEHSLRVSRNVYKVSKKLGLDYVSATRAALLHDFFFNEEFESNRGLIQGVVHPDIALANASGAFKLNDIEKNAIVSHMFPLSTVLPKYKESWVLTVVDKIVAIYEYGLYKFNPVNLKGYLKYLSYSVCFLFILAINFITYGEK